METLIQLHRAKINAKSRIINAAFPGARLVGHYIGGKPVPNRAWLITPMGTDPKKVLKAANIKRAP